MIFSNMIRVQERGFELDPAALERIGVFDRSVCWGVWVPDPRGEKGRRKHLLISPIHPSVWPFLLRLEIKLRDKPRQMAIATRFLVDSSINIQFAESARSGHHHATWNVVGEANDVRGALHDAFTEIQKFPAADRVYTNAELKKFSNQLAEQMLRKAVSLPASMVSAHRSLKSSDPDALDSGFLHNRIVDSDKIKFFYDPLAMPEELVEVARRGLPQAVTCRWMQNLAFFAIYGDMRHPMPLQYHEATRLLKLRDESYRGLARTFERHGERTRLPARAIASFDTSGLYLRIDIIESAEADSRFIEATVDYEIDFDDTVLPGENDTARGLWLSVCEEVAERGIDLVKIANRTTDRRDRSEAGSFTLIGETDTPVDGAFVKELEQVLARRCRPSATVQELAVLAKTTRLRNYTVFVSRRSKMPMFGAIDSRLHELAKIWGLQLDFVKDNYGNTFDEDVEEKVRAADGLLQIVSYSNDELKRARGSPAVLPDLQWLFHEYGIAIGARKPHARVFDETNLDLPGWMQIMSPRGGEAAGSYSRNDDPEEIGKSLEVVIAALARQMDAARRGRAG